MPIDPMLVHGITPVISPAQADAQAMSLRDMMMENTLKQEQVRGAQLANQQSAQAIADDQTYRQYVMDRARGVAQTPAPQTNNLASMAAGPQQASGPQQQPQPPAAAAAVPPQPPGMPGPKPNAVGAPGLDWQQTAQDLRARGLHKQADAVIAAGVGMTEKLSVAAKDQANAELDNVNTLTKRHEMASQSLQGLQDADPAERPALYLSARARLISDGHLVPAEVPETYPGDQWLQGMIAQMTPLGQQLEAKKGALEKQKLMAELPGMEAEAAMKKSQAYAMAHPEDLQAQQVAIGAKDRFDLANKQKEIEETARHNKVGEGQGAQRVAIAGGELKVSQARQADTHTLLQGVTDEGTLDLMAKAVQSGVPISQVVKGRGNAADATVKQVLAKVAAADPNFDLGTALSNYKSESASNVDMTKTYNSIKALHGIVGANLDYAIQTFSKLPDTNSKLLNIPVRMITDKLLSSEPQAEAITALMGASREAARLTNNFGAKGELTDSARHAMDKIHDPNMTLNEFMGAAKAIKTDANNVLGGYKKGRDDVRQNLSAPAAGGARPPLESFFK